MDMRPPLRIGSNWLLAGLLLPLLGGCQSQGGSILFQSVQGRGSLEHSFSQAYVSSGEGGEYQLVLLDQAADWDYGKADRQGRLVPIELMPVRQLVYILLHWRPPAGNIGNPIVANASIHWFVLGPEGSQDAIWYSGAGYVVLWGRGSRLSVHIRQGQVEPKVLRGRLRDPIGPASVRGQVRATVNGAKLRHLLQEILPEDLVPREAGLAQASR